MASKVKNEQVFLNLPAKKFSRELKNLLAQKMAINNIDLIFDRKEIAQKAIKVNLNLHASEKSSSYDLGYNFDDEWVPSKR